MMQDPAAFVARLIEFGFGPPPADPLPAKWDMAYHAVVAIRGSRADRWAAFESAVEPYHDGQSMITQARFAAPIRENRQGRNQYVFNAADALGDPPPVDWIVEGLLTRPSLALLVGDPGSKKTLLSLDLATCIALGKPWLGRQTSFSSNAPAPAVGAHGNAPNPGALDAAVGAVGKPPTGVRVDHAHSSLPPDALDPTVGAHGNAPNPDALDPAVGAHGNAPTPGALDPAVGAVGKPPTGVRAGTPVLIVDEETGRPRLWARLNGVLKAHGADETAPLNFMSLPGYDLRDREQAATLLAKAEAVGAGFIVIDAFADVIGMGDENTTQSILPLINNLRHIAEECRAAILLIHHNNRSGAFRGSSALSAGVDLMLGIDSPADSSLIRLTPLKTRDAAPEPFGAYIHFNGDQFHLTATQDQPESPAKPLSDLAHRVIDRIAFLGQTSTIDLMANVEGASPSATRQIIYDLTSGGYIQRANDGSRGKLAYFELTEKGQQIAESQDHHAENQAT